MVGKATEISSIEEEMKINNSIQATVWPYGLLPQKAYLQTLENDIEHTRYLELNVTQARASNPLKKWWIPA